MTDAASPARRDSEGNPYWTFIVRQSHLQSNRRVAFPPAVGDALGCRLDALRRVSVESPAGCRKLLISREQQEPSRTIIRRLFEPLEKLQAADEQPFDLVVTGPNCVMLRPAQVIEPPQPNTFAAADAMTQLTPWGSPPTPLLPRWYLDAHGGEVLPTDFTSVYPAVRRVRATRTRVGAFETSPSG